MNSRLTMSQPNRRIMSSLRAFALRFSLAFLAVFALAPAIGAQATTGSIRGRVFDEGGQPLANVTVAATNEATGFVQGTQTGADGTYLIRLLPSGTYRVVARRIGQQPQEMPGIRVVVGTTAQVNFNLRTAAVTL